MTDSAWKDRTLESAANPSSIGTRSIQIRGGWTIDRVSLAFLASLVPATAMALFADEGSRLLPIMAIVLVVTFGWQVLFGLVRDTLVGWDGIVTAVTAALMLPLSASAWEVAFAATAGIVLGELIFGGRGRSFLNPAVVGLAFFAFSFPAGMTAETAGLVVWPIFLGAAALLLLGLISWRVVLGGYAGLALAALLSSSLDLATILSPQFAFALVFLGAEPVSAAATNPGRWIHGLLIGSLTILFGGDLSVIFAILLASIFAPLADQGAAWAIRRRTGRPP